MGFDADRVIPPGASIKVIGVGGGGGNAVNTMIRSGLEGVEFVAANTDVQALRFALPERKIQIGKELTKGLGAGADPDIGRDAALEDRHEIQEALTGADMVFITAGMGGGTGTGGASVIAQIARELGALTVAVVTKPFSFEGKRRKKHAEMGIERLRESVDTLITIPNQRLLQIATPDLSMVDAFRMADEVLVNAVKGISDIINIPGTVNVDFADVKTVMSSMGLALMGIGRSRGQNRAVEAARQAISSPLLEDIDIEGATGILINITASSNLSLMEVNEACSIIQEAAHEDANIIFGAVIDEQCSDEIRVTVIATGFPAEYQESEAARGEFSAFNPQKRPQANVRGTYSSPRFDTSNRLTVQHAKSAPPPVAPSFAPTKQTSPYQNSPIQQHHTMGAMPVISAFDAAPSQKAPSFDSNDASSHSELEDLTKLTFASPSALQDLESKLDHIEEPTSVDAVLHASAPAPILHGAAAEPLERRHEQMNVASSNENLFENFEEGKSELSDLILDDENLLMEPAPLESLFDNNFRSGAEEQKTLERDRVISDAVHLANELRSQEERSHFPKDEDLDIPAFLRPVVPGISLE